MRNLHRTVFGLMMAMLLMTAAAMAGDRPASRRAMSFLQLGAGPRAYAMGEAYTGLADDVTALSWNPGGLAQIQDAQILFMHNQWISNLRQEYLAGTYPVFGGCAAGQVSYLNSDIQLRRDEDGVLVGSGFRPYSLAAGLGFGMPLGYGFSAGGSLNYAQEQLDDIAYQSGYLDLGAIYRQPGQWWSLGAALQNSGLPVAGYSLPFTMRAGAAGRFLEDALNFTIDVARTVPGWFRYGMGAEYWYRNLFALRVGYLYRPEHEGLDAFSGFRAGLGFNIQGYQLDYALIPQGDLGYGHRASFTFFFGGGRALVSEKQALLAKAREKGEQALQSGQYNEAIDQYQKVLTFQPSDVQAARMLMKAKEGLRSQERQKELKIRFVKAEQYNQRKQYKDAMEEYQRILLVDEGNTHAATALESLRKRHYAKEIEEQLRAGRAAYRRQQWADALLACQAVLAIAKSNREAREMLDKIRTEMVKGDDGKFKDPRIQEWYLAGLTRFGKADYYGAMQMWEKVLKLAPGHKNARKYMDKARGLRDAQVTQWIDAGQAYIKDFDLVKAAASWRNVLRVYPGHDVAKAMIAKHEAEFRGLAEKRYVLGIQDYTVNQLKQAIANWQDCLTLIPDYPGAKENIEKSRAKLKAIE